MQTELLRGLKDSGKEINASPVAPAALAELVKLVESAKITGAIGKKVFATMFESGRGAAEIIAAQGLGAQVSAAAIERSEEHTSELQSPYDLVCRLLLEKKKTHQK